MKNLMIYISPTGSFDNPNPNLAANDAGQLAKVQIENSLQLGWKNEDIILITNFPWQYGQKNATVLSEVEYFAPKPQSSKINAILKMFEKKMIKKDELYWFHDLDAFQLEKFTNSNIRLGKADMALTDYGRIPKWSTGSIFFTKNSKDIFEKVRDIVHKKNKDEELALSEITKNNRSVNKRIKKLNKTYNFSPFNLRPSYNMAKKPLKVVHFHPKAGVKQLGIENSLLFFMGHNKLQKPLITGRLLRILKYHRMA